MGDGLLTKGDRSTISYFDQVPRLSPPGVSAAATSVLRSCDGKAGAAGLREARAICGEVTALYMFSFVARHGYVIERGCASGVGPTCRVKEGALFLIS